MVSSSQDAWAAAVQFEIGRNVQIAGSNGSFVLNLPCDSCSEVFEFPLAKRFPPEVIKKKLKTKGWRVGSRLVCEHCVKTRPSALKSSTILGRRPIQAVEAVAIQVQPETQEQAMAKLVAGVAQEAKASAAKVQSLSDLAKLLDPPAPAVAPVPEPEVVAAAAPPEPTPEVSKQGHRRMMTLLEEFFAESKGEYLPAPDGTPYNDARIAEESGVPLAHVQANREEWFGLLREPTAFVDLQLRLDELRQKCQSLTEEARQQAAALRSDAEQRAEKIISVAEEAAKDVLEQMQVLASEMDDLVAKNGWAK